MRRGGATPATYQLSPLEVLARTPQTADHSLTCSTEQLHTEHHFGPLTYLPTLTQSERLRRPEESTSSTCYLSSPERSPRPLTQTRHRAFYTKAAPHPRSLKYYPQSMLFNVHCIHTARRMHTRCKHAHCSHTRTPKALSSFFERYGHYYDSSCLTRCVTIGSFSICLFVCFMLDRRAARHAKSSFLAAWMHLVPFLNTVARRSRTAFIRCETPHRRS